MKIRSALLLLATLALTACAPKLVPLQGGSGTINPDSSVSATAAGLAVTVTGADTQINSYNLEKPVTAFGVTVENRSQQEVRLPADAFVLLDEQLNQYPALKPDNVREIIAKDTYYLMPYPYVGYYYLEDYEKLNAYNRFTSKMPYYYEMYPQDIFTKAFPDTAIIPGAKVSGLVYFNIDLRGKKSLKLLVYRNEGNRGKPDLEFPYGIK